MSSKGETEDYRGSAARGNCPRRAMPGSGAFPDLSSDVTKTTIETRTVKKLPFASIEEGIEEIRSGRMVLLADDEDRENECDLVMAAEKVTRKLSTSWLCMVAV